MISLLFVSDGQKHFSESVKEYRKRLGKHVQYFVVSPTKHTNTQFIKTQETQQIIKTIGKFSGTIFLCDEQGETFTSVEFSKLLQHHKNTSQQLLFVIGGAYGVDRDLFAASYDFRVMSFSPFTFPHSLALVILLEQIYRAESIIAGGKYHHG